MFYLERSRCYILSGVLKILTVDREDLVTSLKTTVCLCDTTFHLSIKVGIS